MGKKNPQSPFHHQKPKQINSSELEKYVYELNTRLSKALQIKFRHQFKFEYLIHDEITLEQLPEETIIAHAKKDDIHALLVLNNDCTNTLLHYLLGGVDKRFNDQHNAGIFSKAIIQDFCQNILRHLTASPHANCTTELKSYFLGYPNNVKLLRIYFKIYVNNQAEVLSLLTTSWDSLRHYLEHQ